MHLGISITNFAWPDPTEDIGPTVARLARSADEAGFDSIWTMDHFFQIPITGLPVEDPMLEAHATLAFIAGHTRRARLGTLVSTVAYRHPGVLVKTVTTLDVLSGGRVTFGVGAGSPSTAAALRHEAGGLGIPFPSLAERFERLEETLEIALRMWRGDESAFEGTHYQLRRPLNSPNALQRPHPPILVGGSGETRTLPLVARYADACNLFDIPGTPFQGNLSHKLQVLQDCCAAIGRDPAEIEKTTATAFDLGDDPAKGLRQLSQHLRDLADLGIDHAIVGPHGPWDDDSLAAVASILPEVHEIPVRGRAR